MEAGRRDGLLGQTQRKTHTAMGEAQMSASCAPVSLTPVLTGDRKRTTWPLHTRWVVLPERNPELRDPKCFIRGTPAFGCGGNTVCVFQSWSLHQHTWKESPAQRAVSVSLIRHQECQRPVATCLPRIFLLLRLIDAGTAPDCPLVSVRSFSLWASLLSLFHLPFLFPLRKPISVYLIFWYFQISF